MRKPGIVKDGLVPDSEDAWEDPTPEYCLTLDRANLHQLGVSVHIRCATGRAGMAMAVHAKYHDPYRQYVT